MLARDWYYNERRQIGLDNAADKVSHLHRRLRHARNLMAILLKVGQVTDHENLRQSRRIHLLIHNHAATMIQRSAQQLSERRRLHARSPKRHCRIDAFSIRLNPAGPQRHHLRVRVHLDAQLPQDLLRLGRKIRRIRSEHTRPAIQQRP